PVTRTGAERPRTRSPGTLRRLLSTAERDLSDATGRRDFLAAALGNAGVDHLALAAVAEELAVAEVALSEVEERWLTLAEELGA
ncbi:MAG: hypothetical protein ACRD1K_10685, partial [Acidimicrobiales bacterium]